MKGARPFDHLENLQVAVEVVKGTTLDVPPNCPPQLGDMMKMCWSREPSTRPSFEQIGRKLSDLVVCSRG